MTTQHMHHEHSDADIHTPVAEGSSVSETVTDSTYQAEAPLAEGQADVQNESSAPQHEAISTPSATATPTETTPQASEQTQDNGVQSQVEEPDTTASEPNGGSTIEEPQRAEELEMRPFTSFIEEFQQEQARLNVPPAERETETIVAFSSEATPAPFLVPEFGAAWEQTVSPTPVTQASEAQQAGEIPEFLAALSEAATETPATGETTSTPEPGEAKHVQVNPEEAAPAAQTPAERPVSPLLRPASRIRVPRHHSRQREEAAQATQATQTPDSTEKQAQEESPLTTTTRAETATQAAATPEPAQPRPGRRYRFDRPAKNAVATTPPHSEEHKEAANRAVTTPPASTENGNGHTQPAQKHVVPAQPAETPTAKTDAATESASETTSGSQTQAATGEHEQHGRRRHSQERQREKEQAHATPAVTAPSTPTPVAEPVAQATPAAQAVEPPVVPAQPEEVNPEDLPPLEYADLQAANSRRRRRRRPTTPVGNTNTSAAAPSGNAPLAVKPVTPEVSAQGTPTVVPTPAPAPAAQVSAPPVTGPRATPTPGGQYNIVSGYTVSQMNQNGDGVGPFMGPDPSPARGSIPGHALRTGRAEVQRAPAYPPLRTEPSGASVNHLATVVAQAIQTQTDRMVAELRRANQGPTNVAVTLPPFPSTERVGVFVDVANLLYSARTMRINIDFGKLLDFLRGNRRLVRAQAYCPTSPQAGDEQMFLQAVKGLGYRITTKNYKTFSSGAKKADLDLDLCMDVVRLVDGRAVDCIVLVSGDSDFMPMLDYCSDHGVRVEVAAFDEAMSATLRQSCDLFINLSMLSEIRA